MSNWEVAVVREQGQIFAVVAVKDHVIESPSERQSVIAVWSRQLGCRVALLGARRGRTFGPNDIVRWLTSISVARLPWRQMTLTAS